MLIVNVPIVYSFEKIFTSYSQVFNKFIQQ